jgi:hypothetical protein
MTIALAFNNGQGFKVPWPVWTSNLTAREMLSCLKFKSLHPLLATMMRSVGKTFLLPLQGTA